MKEYDVLYALTKSSEPVRLTDLHRRVLLSQPALSRLVDRLVERGLVERCADAGDKRVVRLTLTEAGRSCQREVGRAHARDVAAAMTARVTDGDLEELKRITRALLGTQDLGPKEMES
jgi:DNA-binding MarR family transcriptional regulator